MLWITDSVGKLWQAYREGLTLSCPTHNACARDRVDRTAAEAPVQAAIRQMAPRALH